MTTIAAFALLSLIITVTPGPDSLLVLRSSPRAGRRAGIRVAAGATSGPNLAACASWPFDGLHKTSPPRISTTGATLGLRRWCWRSFHLVEDLPYQVH
jgi:threonine/homoserine/homoserine lactone efflux protein